LARQQKKKVNGEESLLFFENFPHVGLSKVRVNLFKTTTLNPLGPML
jgi:hypothetical protein